MDTFEGFLDDYFAECDEHLTAARRALVTLDRAMDNPATERAVVEELFRIYHSLKGISGMVELRAAEQLAHELESYLRALRAREVRLTTEGVETLIDGTRRLEQVIAARKQSASTPATDDLVGRLTRLVHDGAPPAAPAEASPPPADRWRVVFEPSRELAARGLGVDAVRKRLSEIGRIESAAPHVGGEGAISFEFVVAVASGGGTALDPIREQGVRCERVVAPVPPPADVAGAEPDPAGGTVAPSHYVRVDLTRLDDLMRSVGDLVISRARLADSLARVEARVPPVEWRAVQENAATIDRQLRTLREGIMRVRLVPVGEIFRRMPFVVRDLARSLGKRVELQLAGQSTEIDKYVIERMMDPVLHLVRNAISHGIESPDERVAAGKPPSGEIRLTAAASGDMVTIEIADDGRGIDAEAVAARARSAGLAVPHAPLDPAGLLAILCAPGFSTRDDSDRAAGRGVGMAVVKTTVEALSGSIALETQAGAGTRFTIALPLTLAIADALIARVGGETFALPQATVREVLDFAEADVRALEQHEVVPYRGGALPIVRLGGLFGIAPRAGDHRHLFVIGYGAAAVGLVVDRIVGQREIVVRAIADPLVKVEGISGATDLGDGHVVLILDGSAIARLARRRAIAMSAWPAAGGVAGVA